MYRIEIGEEPVAEVEFWEDLIKYLRQWPRFSSLADSLTVGSWEDEELYRLFLDLKLCIRSLRKSPEHYLNTPFTPKTLAHCLRILAEYANTAYTDNLLLRVNCKQ